jgi:F-type H+-transporting ATPase subunit b
MSRLASAVAEIHRIAGAHFDIDDQGYTTQSPLWPERAELIYGGIASVVVIGILIWKAGPLVKKAMAARTEKIQGELDEAAAAREAAESEAARIRQSLGNIDAERERLLAEADAQAAALVTDGRARLEAEIAELESKTEAELAGLSGRAADELRSEIAKQASAAAEIVVERSLDDATHQRLIEDFIAKVGAMTPATSGARP